MNNVTSSDVNIIESLLDSIIFSLTQFQELVTHFISNLTELQTFLAGSQISIVTLALGIGAYTVFKQKNK